MPEILVTFIVPAYNAAPYVKACVDSIFSLDLKGHDREVIAVNDGSNDGTAEVLEQCSKEHESLQVLSQENLGPSMARNAAMDIAKGRYICFVDADDEMDYESDIRPLLLLLEKGEMDIIGMNTEQVDMKGVRAPYRSYVPIYNKVYSPAREFMRGRNLFPCAWSYMYRRQFLEAADLRFMPGVLHEDEEFTVKALAMATSFVAVDVPLYVRVLRRESITTTTDKGRQRRKLRDRLKVQKSLEAFAREKAEYAGCLRCKLDYIVLDTLFTMMVQRHPRSFQKEIVKELRKMKLFPLHWHWNVKYMAFNIFTRILYMFG